MFFEKLKKQLSVFNEVSATGTISKSIVPGLSQIAEIDEQNKITYIHQDILGSTSLITDEAGVDVVAKTISEQELLSKWNLTPDKLFNEAIEAAADFGKSWFK